MSEKGAAYIIHIDAKKLSRLLRSRIDYINKDYSRKGPKKLPVLDADTYKKIIERYFQLCFSSAIDTGEAISFPLVGNIGVVKKISKKGYSWDSKYGGKDYELIIHTNKNVDISVDKQYYQQIIDKVDAGLEYDYDVINHAERLEEIISLLNGKPTGIKQRRNQIVA